MDTSVEQAFQTAPVNRRLGLQLLDQSEDTATVSAPAAPDFEQETGVIHGGILSTLADTACVYALVPGLSEGQSMTSIEFKVNFLRPARVGADDLIAQAKCVKRGRSIGVCEVDVFQAEELVAKGLFTYMLLG